MKAKIILAIVWFGLIVGIQAADAEGPRFIRSAGVYHIASDMTLTISSDASGALRYSFDRMYHGEQSSGQVGHEGPLTRPFIFYWDDSSKTLWQATTKEIIAHTPKGMTVYDNVSKTLKLTPESFRKEVQQTFELR